jgi:amino acid transporter
MLRQAVLTPLLGVLGAQSAALWFAQTPEGSFLASILTLAIVTGYIMLGMKRYARIQKICFYGGMVGLVIVIGLLLAGSPEGFKAGLETNATAVYGAQPGVYDSTVQLGTDAGAAMPLRGGSLKLIMLTLPYLVFFNLWPNWGATLYGEVRGATDFKRNLSGMAWALGITTLLAIGVLLAISKTIGWDFYNQANGAWWNFSWGYTDQAPALPVWPYPAMLASFLTTNRAVQFIVIALMSLWWFGWSGTVFLSSTRVVFAAAFDRLLPEKVAEVDERSGTPVTALLLMVIPAILVSALWAWNFFNFHSLTLASTLVIAVTFLGTTIGAILLPYRKPDLYNASPIAKYKVFGIPLITVAGVIFGGFLIFLLYQWILDPNALYGIGYSINEAGIKNTTSIIFMLVLYGLAAGIYFGFKAYRMRHGIDIDKVHQEIPVE